MKAPLVMKALLITVAVVLIASVAGATVDENGVLHGCTRIKNGALRVVEPGQACRQNETPLTWNQEGPQGPAAADNFEMLTGSVMVNEETPRVPYVVSCPDNRSVFAASAWVTVDPGWGGLSFSLPMSISASNATIDWLSWVDDYGNLKLSWNITCGGS